MISDGLNIFLAQLASTKQNLHAEMSNARIAALDLNSFQPKPTQKMRETIS